MSATDTSLICLDGLTKVFSTDGMSFLQAVGTMTGMSTEEYQAMMIAGGRSPEGQRSIREKR